MAKRKRPRDDEAAAFDATVRRGRKHYLWGARPVGRDRFGQRGWAPLDEAMRGWPATAGPFPRDDEKL